MALTHRSYCAEHPGTESNERLEFLGDAVLSMAVTEHLYRSFPDRAEGELSPIRAAVVSQARLAEAARGIDLGSVIRLGKGEEQMGGRDRPSILADAVEALFGAVYIDGGWDQAQPVVATVMAPVLATTLATPATDSKSRLQELAAEQFANAVPTYALTSTGPDHDKRFRAKVFIAGRVMGEGQGRSKKEAEQAAAGAALAVLAGDPSTKFQSGEESPNA